MTNGHRQDEMCILDAQCMGSRPIFRAQTYLSIVQKAKSSSSHCPSPKSDGNHTKMVLALRYKYCWRHMTVNEMVLK